MKNAITTSLQIVLLLAVCCSAFTPAHADIVPWLTGQFDYDNGGDGEPMSGWLRSLPYGYLSLNVDAHLTYVTSCPEPYLCITNFDGPIVSGTGTLDGVLSPYDPNVTYNMTVGVLGGYIYGYSVDDEIGTEHYTLQWSSYIFKGAWNTNWISFGSGSDEWNSDSGYTSGTLNMTTYSTPEPSSFAMFGSGILGVAGVLLRRLSV